jgi:hypothetical protein
VENMLHRGIPRHVDAQKNSSEKTACPLKNLYFKKYLWPKRLFSSNLLFM